MKNVIPFEYESKKVRVIQDEEGEFWFVAKDVCQILGIENHNDTVAKVLEDDEKGVDKIDTLGGPQEMLVVSESGLYTLIIRSNKEAAKPFRRWVTHEVLPAIRKTGRYVAPVIDDDARAPGHVAPLSDEAMDRLRSGADKLICVARAFDASYRVYRRIGSMNHRQKIVAANRLTREETGVDCLAMARIRDYVPNWDFEGLAEKKGMTMFKDLMESLIPVDGNNGDSNDICYTVREIVSDAGMYVKFGPILERCGVKKTNNGVFLHPASIEEHLLMDAHHNWSRVPVRDTLLRIPGARSVQLRLSGSPVRGVVVPAVAMPAMEGGRV